MADEIHSMILVEFRARNLSFRSLAKELNVSPSTVCRVSLGKRRSQRIEKAIANKIQKPHSQIFKFRKIDRGDD